MSAKAKMILAEEIGKLKEINSPELKKSVDDIEESTLKYFKEKKPVAISDYNETWIEKSLKPFENREKFSRFFEIIFKSGEENEDLEIRAEYVDRLADLFFLIRVFSKYIELSSPEINKLEQVQNILKVKINKCINWFGERGKKEDANILQELKTQVDEDLETTITQSQERIYNREFKDLSEFFSLELVDFNKIIEANLQFSKNIEHPAMREIYKLEAPSEIFDLLINIKDLLQKYKTNEDIKLWLNSPINDFKNLTPKQAIINGRALPVLSYLKILEERLYK